MPEDLKISLPLFEGPLDLLLDMIRRQKLDIYDIPIARVAEQYLSYLRLMQELNIDVASEFLRDRGAIDLHQIANAPAPGSGCRRRRS